MAAHVFAYGSLAAVPSGRPATLRGYRRVWGVAMDNAVTIPGYKLYRAPDGSRPDVCVAFLDLEPSPDDAVDGLLLAVDDEALRALDRRERNYHRTDVTHAVDGRPRGDRVWAYLGREDSRARLQRARAQGRAVVDAAYAGAVARFAATTVPSGLPELPLRRVEVPDRLAAG
jgi:gamma-glutamylcyclotransferase (GGCT)/AIG2-like uncharacterized protein YtfP